MSESGSQNFGYTQYKTPEGLQFSVYKDKNSTSLVGNYYTILTKKRKNSAVFIQVNLDISDENAQLYIDFSGKNPSNESDQAHSFNGPDEAFNFIDAFAKKKQLVSMISKKRNTKTF